MESELLLQGSVTREDVRGRYPSICANDHNTVIEIQQPLGRSKLRYAVGHLSNQCNKISWKGVNELGEGTYARVALNNKNTVFEVHEHPLLRKICYRVGALNPENDIIDWDESQGDHELWWGRFPAVALTDNDEVVIVYESAKLGSYDTFYRIGKVITDTDGGRKRMGSWTIERRLFREPVNELSITMNKKGCIVAAGRRSGRQICLTVGKMPENACAGQTRISWSAAQTNPLSIGCCPAVSIDNEDYIVLVIQTYLGRRLFYQVGKVNTEQNEVRLGQPKDYDYGCYPTVVLCNNHRFLEEHQTNFFIPRGNRLFNHVGQIQYNSGEQVQGEEHEEE